MTEPIPLTDKHRDKLHYFKGRLSRGDFELLGLILQSDISGPFSNERILNFLTTLDAKDLFTFAPAFLQVISAINTDYNKADGRRIREEELKKGE